MIAMINFRNEKKYDFILVLVLTLILLISFYTISFSSTLKKGLPAPAFTLKTIEEETISLKAFKEKQALLVLYFYSQYNQDSLRGIGELNKYFENHLTQERYELLLVNIQDNLQKEDIDFIKNYLDANKIIFPVLLDKQNEVSRLYNVENLPTAIFLDKNLFVKSIYPGFTSTQQALIFQHVSYLLDSIKRDISKNDKRDKKPREDKEPSVDEEPPVVDEELPPCCSSKSLNL